MLGEEIKSNLAGQKSYLCHLLAVQLWQVFNLTPTYFLAQQNKNTTLTVATFREGTEDGVIGGGSQARVDPQLLQLLYHPKYHKNLSETGRTNCATEGKREATSRKCRDTVWEKNRL